MRMSVVMSSMILVLLQFGCAHEPARVAATVAKPDMPPCAGATCRVPVLVTVPDAGGCNVLVPYGNVTVAKRNRPRVVWYVVKADPSTDHFHYQFRAGDGIDIINNDPAYDFDLPDYEPHGNPSQFKWDSVNGRRDPKTFNYEVNVQQSPNPHGPWTDCTKLDPKITNDGN